MKVEEQKAVLDKLLLVTEQSERVTLLNTLQADYAEMSESLTKATLQYEATKKENETLSDINRKLFLSAGKVDTVLESHDSETSNKEPPKKLSYDDLEFN